jgi:hypothetical protein
VETSEGYYAEATPNATATVLLVVTDMAFNETNANDMNVTVENSAISRASVDITDIALTYRNGTADQEYHINGSKTNPPFAPYYHLAVGKNVTFNHCLWNWTNFRSQNVTITVYTEQGYTPVSKAVTTLAGVVFTIGPNFDLANTGLFSVNITNMPISLQNITVTHITLNTNPAGFTSQTILINTSKQIDCTFNWATLRGNTVTVKVNASNVVVSQNITLPHVKLTLTNAYFVTGNNGKEFNITIENSNNSTLNATIARIVVRFENGTVFQSEGVGYLVETGKNVTLIFSWDWSAYKTKEVTISIYTTEDLEFFKIFQV